MNHMESLAQRGPEFRRLLRQEELILDVTERFCEALNDEGVTRAELARRLERSPSFVSQLLAGGRNLTLRTIADVSDALSLQASFVLTPTRSPRENPVENADWMRQPRQWREMVSTPAQPASGHTAGQLAAAA